jgi:hypothetical protein
MQTHALASWTLSMLALAGVALAVDYPPADHGGADLLLSDGDRIWGAHTNVGRFVVPEGAKVDVHRYYPAVAASGCLDVDAREIEIAGKLNAEGAGYTGGGGGSGRPAFGYQPQYDGKEGKAGKPRYTEYNSEGSLWPHAWGDGPAGGITSSWNPSIRNGGYDDIDVNTDMTTDTSVLMGSGGAGGYGDASVNTLPVLCFPRPRGGTGGNGGGPGGGAVRLVASERLAISGTVYTVGATGGAGRAGVPGYAAILQTECVYHGSDGGDGGTGDVVNNGRGNAGSGAGGGVLLLCLAKEGLEISGEVDTRSSEWRSQGLPTDGVRNGGTLKIMYSGDAPTSGTLLSGRTFFRDLDDEPLEPFETLLGRVPRLPSMDRNQDGVVDAADATGS